MPHEFYINSPIGALKLTASELGIQALEFTESRIANPTLDSSSAKAPLVSRIQTQLNEYFAGSRHTFDLPFDLRGTEFQIKIWNLLQAVPYGRTISYAKLADLYGERNATRAIAAANAKNKIAILIPCHRVIGSDGSLSGYAWGVDRKRHLLELEGGLPKQQQFSF